MDFSLIGPDKLKVTIDPAELDALGTSYEQLNYKDKAARRTLVDILTRGQGETGFNPARSQLYIEAYPSTDGGCVIYYTRLSGGEVSPGGVFMPGPCPHIFAFGEEKSLITAAAKTWPLYGSRILASSLYYLNTDWRLIVYPLDFSQNLSVNLLCEYGRLVGKTRVLAAYIDEHAKLIAGQNALELLAQIEL